MQGQRGTIGSFPVALDLEHGSTSSIATMDQQILWNNLRNSAEDHLPDHAFSPSDANITSMNSICHEGSNLGRWSLGGPSSSSIASVGGNMKLEEGVREPANPFSNGRLLLHSPNSSAILQDLNITSHSDSGDDCKAIEQSLPASSISDPFGTCSRSGFHLSEDNAGRTDGFLQGGRLSCKRKVFDKNVPQSSVDGSSNFQHAEGSLCHVVPPRNTASVSLGMATPFDNNHGVGIARPRISARNVRRRVNPSHNQNSTRSNVFPRGNGSNSHLNISSPIPSVRFLPVNYISVSELEPTVDDMNSLNHSIGWCGDSRSISDNSSSRTISTLGSMPIIADEHFILIPTTQLRNSSQNPINLNLSGRDITILGNASSSGSNRAHHRSLEFPRSLSEMVPPSLLSSVSLEADGQYNNQLPFHSAPLVSSQEIVFSSGSGNQAPQQFGRSEMSFYRQGDGLLGFPYPMWNFSTLSERRLVSEICNVLDLVRRGEGVRFEDHFMLLDPSILFAVADTYDRYRDMRLDADNMSYEELLALEERIGNVCTGLSDESILRCLKQLKYSSSALGSEVDMEPCCICQEEYIEGGGEIGKLGCGHEFHTVCIKQWLTQKNLCPICKTEALKDH